MSAALTPDAEAKLAVEIIAWRSFEKNTLQGFATVRLPALHLVIHGVAIHRGGRGRWVQLPAEPNMKGNVPVINRDAGKIEYTLILAFDRKDVGDRFRDRVLEALDRYLVQEGLG